MMSCFNAIKRMCMSPFGAYVKAYILLEHGNKQSVVYGKVEWTRLLTEETVTK